MSEVKTLATLVLGGMFDHRELGDIDMVYEMPACEALQRDLVTSVDDVHVELVSRTDYDAAQALSVENIMMDVVPGFDGMGEQIYAKSAAEVQLLISNLYLKTDELEESLKAAEQRNSSCNAEIVAMVESALRRSFSLGQIYWQQADSDSTCQQNKSDQTMEIQAQHILNVIKSINDLTKAAE